MATKRLKVSAEPVLRGLDEAQAAMRELCEIETAMMVEQARVDRIVTKAREISERRLEGKPERRVRLEKDLEEFFTYHKAEYFTDDRKTFSTLYGDVVFRLDPPSIVVSKKGSWTVAGCIAAIRQLFPRVAKSVIREPDPELNKPALKGWSDEDLGKVGLERKQKEHFAVVLRLEAGADAGVEVGVK